VVLIVVSRNFGDAISGISGRNTPLSDFDALRHQ